VWGKVMKKAIFGIEEEIFIVEPEKPTLRSLYYLARLLWKDPRFYYFHTASNFARGRDIKQGLMSGIEISTSMHQDVDSLIEDLASRRKDLMDMCQGLIIPLGHLINYEAPTNTCALQIHIGSVEDQQRVYKNLVHFLPLLILLTVNSPYARGKYFGQSFRIAKSFAIGCLRSDWEYRFQDIILAKRLGTIEIRVFDPIWDLGRIRTLVRVIKAIVDSERNFDFDITRYNELRFQIAVHGYDGSLDEIFDELVELHHVPKELFLNTPSDQVKSYFERNGLLRTYSALDNAYRTGIFESKSLPEMEHGEPSWESPLKICAGFLGYYIPKLPYCLWKVWREW